MAMEVGVRVIDLKKKFEANVDAQLEYKIHTTESVEECEVKDSCGTTDDHADRMQLEEPCGDNDGHVDQNGDETGDKQDQIGSGYPRRRVVDLVNLFECNGTPGIELVCSTEPGKESEIKGLYATIDGHGDGIKLGEKCSANDSHFDLNGDEKNGDLLHQRRVVDLVKQFEANGGTRVQGDVSTTEPVKECELEDRYRVIGCQGDEFRPDEVCDAYGSHIEQCDDDGCSLADFYSRVLDTYVVVRSEYKVELCDTTDGGKRKVVRYCAPNGRISGGIVKTINTFTAHELEYEIQLCYETEELVLYRIKKFDLTVGHRVEYTIVESHYETSSSLVRYMVKKCHSTDRTEEKFEVTKYHSNDRCQVKYEFRDCGADDDDVLVLTSTFRVTRVQTVEEESRYAAGKYVEERLEDGYHHKEFMYDDSCTDETDLIPNDGSSVGDSAMYTDGHTASKEFLFAYGNEDREGVNFVDGDEVGTELILSQTPSIPEEVSSCDAVNELGDDAVKVRERGIFNRIRKHFRGQRDSADIEVPKNPTRRPFRWRSLFCCCSR